MHMTFKASRYKPGVCSVRLYPRAPASKDVPEYRCPVRVVGHTENPDARDVICLWKWPGHDDAGIFYGSGETESSVCTPGMNDGKYFIGQYHERVLEALVLLHVSLGFTCRTLSLILFSKASFDDDGLTNLSSILSQYVVAMLRHRFGNTDINW